MTDPSEPGHGAFALLAAASPPFGGHGTVHSPAVDAMALVMLGLVFVLVGGFTALAVRIYRRALQPEPIGQFLDEIADEEHRGSRPATAGADHRAPAQPWEQEADWWKAKAVPDDNPNP